MSIDARRFEVQHHHHVWLFGVHSVDSPAEQLCLRYDQHSLVDCSYQSYSCDHHRYHLWFPWVWVLCDCSLLKQIPRHQFWLSQVRCAILVRSTLKPSDVAGRESISGSVVTISHLNYLWRYHRTDHGHGCPPCLFLYVLRWLRWHAHISYRYRSGILVVCLPCRLSPAAP